MPSTPTTESHVLALEACSTEYAGIVGGKAHGLHSLIVEGLPVPEGFAVTTVAYRASIAHAGLEDQITDLLAGAGSFDGDAAASAAIADLFTPEVMPAEVADAISAAYVAMGEGPVAVRSSAVAEDTAEASFAGQQDTYLWISGVEQVLAHVVRCWASLFTPHVIAYRAKFGVPPEDVAMAVVVQRMVPAVAAGVTMTLEPVTGDRGQIYVESALGLGEGVVKGDVETDRAWIAKDSLAVLRREVGVQSRAYRFDPAAGGVRLLDLPASEGSEPSLTPGALRRIGELAVAIENAHGKAMDIEWAVDDKGEVLLLQARPETVWSQRTVGPPEGWDHPNALNYASDPASTWTTVNAAEGIPGVQVPLAWSVVSDAAERAFRQAFKATGILTRAETAIPRRVQDRVVGLFFGRLAIHLNLICEWVDRAPGTSGEAMSVQVFGNVPAGYVSQPNYRHYPRVASQVAVPFVRYPGRVRADRVALETFWSDSVRRIPTLDPAEARRVLAEAAGLFERCIINHTSLVLGAVQPSYDLLDRVCTGTTVPGQDLMAGHGSHEETAVLGDVWACSRNELTLNQFIARHGYHGPREGDMTATVWREDPAPVSQLIDAYRAKPDSEAPTHGATQRTRTRLEKEKQLLSELPAYKRPLARIALKLAERYLPMRGIGKVAFLQALDVARASARRIGDLLQADGLIDDREDVFFLTLDELAGGCPPDARALINERRKFYAYYQSIDLPNVWQGAPDPATVEFDPDAESVDGIAASPGIIEGPVRVVLDPGDAHVEPGEILVARDTDPSWASLMFLSAGLIADIGGVMSHTAVVARELAIPCVVNTKIATHILRTGDVVRMDGGSGRIEIVSRAALAPPTHPAAV